MRWLGALLCALALLAGVARAEEVELDHGETDRYAFEWAPGLDGYARALMEDVEEQHDRIYDELGAVAPDGRTRVSLLRDEADMLALARARHRGHPPEWAEGLAYPEARAIFLHVGSGPDALKVTLQHEISHVALGDLSGRGAPRWFSEGVAIRQSEGFSMERAWLLTEAATMGALHPLRDLSRGFPASGARAGVAYAQAVHFVGYLQAEFGMAKFRALLARLRGGEADFAAAVATTYGRSLDVIEADWQSTLKVRWGWIPVLFGSTTLWSLAALALVWGWRRRRRQQADRIEAMRKDEVVEMADDIEIAHGLDAPSSLHDPYDGRPPTIH